MSAKRSPKVVTPKEVPIQGEAREAYVGALKALSDAKVPFLVGGGFAMHQYLSRWRSTKDLDVFITSPNVAPALRALANAGFRVELTDPSWLAKAFRESMLIDMIFSSYNGLLPVDEGWFENARTAEVMGVPVQLVGPEEMVVSKAFVAARDRFDGSDISWLIKTVGDQLDWSRVERLMGDHWEVLLWQLIHFRYVFPKDCGQVPDALLGRLLSRMQDNLRSGAAPTTHCRGPMFDAIHYLAAMLEPEDANREVSLASH